MHPCKKYHCAEETAFEGQQPRYSPYTIVHSQKQNSKYFHLREDLHSFFYDLHIVKILYFLAIGMWLGFTISKAEQKSLSF